MSCVILLLDYYFSIIIVFPSLVKHKGSHSDSDEGGQRHGKPYPLCSPKQAELDLWEREVRKVRGGNEIFAIICLLVLVCL